ncbi:AAA family ATPase [Candidatus Woesearchaeota archaeon]|nr:AAA family ATPase [Candidatus Woesearchaeota archaeon]
MPDTDSKDLVKLYSTKINNLKTEVGKVIVGQEHMIDSLIYALLSDGHILLEGVPGLAKSLAVETLAHAVEGSFQRIQFTPDMLPFDILGAVVYNQKTQEFVINKGPIFNNIILADEINRTSPKTQSALLQAMQERQVSIETHTYTLNRPFMVLATMNPLEQEGVYPLAEAQIDRFMLKINIGYPSKDELEKLLQAKNSNFEQAKKDIQKVISLEEVLKIQQLIHKNVYANDRVRSYITSICVNTQPPKTRNPKDVSEECLEPKNWVVDYEQIKMGSSPRGAEYLQAVSKTHAFVKGRNYVTLDDVTAMAKDVLRHRIILSQIVDRSEVSEDIILDQILQRTKLPE